MKARIFTLTVGATIVLLLTTTGAFIANSINKSSFKEEKVRNESLITQKNNVSKDLDKVKSDLAALTAKNLKTEKSLSETGTKLAQKEKSIVYMNNQLKQDKNEIVKLQKSSVDQEKAYTDLKLEDETALSKIKELENSALLLDAEKKDLTSRLENAEKYRVDNIDIYASTGNKKDKITFLARRTKKLNISFEVPQSLPKEMSCKIITPAGTTISPDNKSLTWLISSNQKNMTASLSNFSGEFVESKRVMVTYTPTVKLAAGEYEIQIFSNDKNIGDCRLNLR